MSWLRNAMAIGAGFVVAFLCVVGVEGMSEVLHPMPKDIDWSDPEVCHVEVMRHVARYPTWVLALCGAGWALTVLASTYVTTLVAAQRHPAPGWILGGLLLALAVLNMSMLPYPIWFWIANLISFPLATWLGVRLPRKATPLAPPRATTAEP